MRILIFGGDGMLGHRLLAQFAPRHETWVTLHRPLDAYSGLGCFGPHNAIGGVDVRDVQTLAAVLGAFRPEAVVNASGIVKQRTQVDDREFMEVNAIFPHVLARLCQSHGARLVHLSTDCVFSGKKGNYSEEDRPDPEDVYGLSKLLGEVDDRSVLTLRTSMIGLELHRKTGLVEWLLAQRGRRVKGWRKAIFSGFTTAELARLIERLIVQYPGASGLYHASSAPISKYDLLVKINSALRIGVEIVPDDSVICDRSLDSARFRSVFGYTPPTWDTMVTELAAEILESRSGHRDQ
jgi:dTDP-4-dehydrorhamnose reductase